MTIRAAVPEYFNRPRLTAADGMNGWCGIQDCREPQYQTYPLCEEHAWDMWREMDMRKNADRAREAAEIRREQWEYENYRRLAEKHEAKRKGTFQSDPGTVYYLRVEDQIKIGWTAKLETRLSAYPPMAELLATHPGTRKTERLMHEKFAAHLAGRAEWFEIHNELSDHIQSVRQQFKQHELVAA